VILSYLEALETPRRHPGSTQEFWPGISDCGLLTVHSLGSWSPGPCWLAGLLDNWIPGWPVLREHSSGTAPTQLRGSSGSGGLTLGDPGNKVNTARTPTV